MPTIAKNKRAYFDYNILETIEAGIVLAGYEVKSVKLGHISLKGAFVTIKDNEAYLLNADISPYQPANMPKDYDSARSRKLLLNRREIAHLIGKSKIQGLTVLPLSMYTKKTKIKVEIAVAKGKKKYEKRETLKKKESDKEIRKTMKYE
ncbi:MAG: SsrA-binding protein [Candidatus Spechtbacteria bacterium RIFCSPHIGHO2_02_FULL_43_15b]|uniref:SsrA-binding protein n=1 Tax=Candidatus Spechtbacteria bacterium RIFCSPHIGHO2_01_FULL_43_30 TaxID=1802158 RepID=A0A1G2H679_9BACT|nr:MAG: SsrA-binding protein [Candidatus Spechtbacteria bacterium RIFCSPHIGHO2_01_FULL_43_30]OGZ58608.1 MAG: SsrA-binding protein [Candidatus Spechtbacteria bacterium RIFCSPHIGHO2_02_FULL_43_15b]